MSYRRSNARKTTTALTSSCDLLFLFSTPASGQAGIDTGAIAGTVKDLSGALVPGAKITLTNKATGEATSFVGTGVGAHTFPFVQVGTYFLQVQAKGFKDTQVNGVVVHLGSTLTEDVPLQVGAESQVVVRQRLRKAFRVADWRLGNDRRRHFEQRFRSHLAVRRQDFLLTLENSSGRRAVPAALPPILNQRFLPHHVGGPKAIAK